MNDGTQNYSRGDAENLVNPVHQGNLKCPVTFGLAASHYRSIELEFDVAVCIYSDQAT